MLTTLLGIAAGWPVPVVLAVAAMLLVAESGTIVGMALPGTTLLVALGLWSNTAPNALPPAIAVAAAATVSGAHMGWSRGRARRSRRSDREQVRGRPLRAFHTRAAEARRWLAGRGTAATAALLVGGHWAAAARPVMPRVAGGAGVPYRIAGPAVALSGTAWATTLVLLGNRIGAHVLTHASWAPIVFVVLLIGALALRSRRHAKKNRLIRGAESGAVIFAPTEVAGHRRHLAAPYPAAARPPRADHGVTHRGRRAWPLPASDLVKEEICHERHDHRRCCPPDPRAARAGRADHRGQPRHRRRDRTGPGRGRCTRRARRPRPEQAHRGR